jgi:hypothetical protein
MSNKKYLFTSSKSETLYNDIQLPPIKFYQICGFPNPRLQKIEIREVIINGRNDIERFRTLHVTKKVQMKVLKTLKENQYRLYATVDLNSIELPSCADIALARSGILNHDSDYTGYAQVNNSNQEFDWRGWFP